MKRGTDCQNKHKESLSGLMPKDRASGPAAGESTRQGHYVQDDFRHAPATGLRPGFVEAVQDKGDPAGHGQPYQIEMPVHMPSSGSHSLSGLPDAARCKQCCIDYTLDGSAVSKVPGFALTKGRVYVINYNKYVYTKPEYWQLHIRRAHKGAPGEKPKKRLADFIFKDHIYERYPPRTERGGFFLGSSVVAVSDS